MVDTHYTDLHVSRTGGTDYGITRMTPNDADMGATAESESQPAMPEEAPEEAGGQGYEIHICVYPDGTFRVKKRPLEAEPAEAGDQPDEGEYVSKFEDALRAALKLFKSNPASGSDQANFEAGAASVAPKAAY